MAQLKPKPAERPTKKLTRRPKSAAKPPKVANQASRKKLSTPRAAAAKPRAAGKIQSLDGLAIRTRTHATTLSQARICRRSPNIFY